MVKDIKQSRINSFGASETKFLYSIGKRGFLTNKDKQRIRVYIGLEDFEIDETSPAATYGHQVEDILFEYLKTKYPNERVYQERKLVININGINLHSNFDFWLSNSNTFLELKTSKFPSKKVYETYIYQLMLQNTILQKECGKCWLHKLVHYKYDEIGETFDKNKLKSLTLFFKKQYINNFLNIIHSATLIIKDCIDRKTYNEEVDLSLPFVFPTDLFS